jgi:hypothetical protein
VALVALFTMANAALASGDGIVPPSNPNSNVSAERGYSIVNNKRYVVGGELPPCWVWSKTQQLVARATRVTCVHDEIVATDRAQRIEGLGPIGLPTNFSALSVPEQLFVMVDIERVSRGEAPVVGLSAQLNQLAQRAADARQAPRLTPASDYRGATGEFAANWAGAISALDANYIWMYIDGWAGRDTDNYDCTTAHAPGCWAHRDNILVNASRMPCPVARCSLVMGGGYVHLGAGDNFSSFSELFVQVTGTPSDLYYSWAQAVADGAAD